jgi:hypothetical protein
VGVVLALAPPAGRGRPRLAIGTATEYFAEEVPEADYLFYCYGSRMMVARRINQADLSVNLGVLMRRLGAGGDGGHAGAAVSRPEANERYPRRLLGRVSSANFGGFARYLAFRLEEEGYRVRAVEDRSRRTGPGARQASMRLAACVLIAAAVGLVLVLFRPAFRPSAVRDSNRDFYPHVTAQDADGGQPPEEDGP